MFRHIFQTVKMSFCLDVRSLALLRVLMGFLVIMDASMRWPNLESFYTDQGILPRSVFIQELAKPWSWSIHLANGSLGYAKCLFALQVLSGLFLMLGAHSKKAGLMSFFVVTSAHNRNWLISNGGDDVLRSLLFFCIFLPMSKCFSIDSALQEKKHAAQRNEQHFSYFSIAYFLQVFVIYFFSFLHKTHAQWRVDYTAIAYALQIDLFTTPFALWLRQFPEVLKFLTMITIHLEHYGPFLLVCSWVIGARWYWARLLAIVCFVGLHIGIISVMKLGLFPYTCIAMWFALIPVQFWDALLGRFRKNMIPLKIYYDEGCAFCKKSVFILREFFLLPETQLIPAQSNPDMYQIMQQHTSWVLTHDKGRFVTFSAFVEIMRASPILKYGLFLTYFPWFHTCGSRVYHWVSHNRGIVSQMTPWFPFHDKKPPGLVQRTAYSSLGLMLGASMLMWNLSTINRWNISNPYLSYVTRWLHLYQDWNMFSPFPVSANTWVEVNGFLSDTSQIELLTGVKDHYANKYKEFHAIDHGEHWRKFYLNVSDKLDHVRFLAAFECKKWHSMDKEIEPPTKLQKVELNTYAQANLGNGRRGPIERRIHWEHVCDQSLSGTSQKF